MKSLTSALLIRAATLPLAALESGDAVSLDALAKTEFVKGDAPKEWKPGEVYIFECWATWCAPCVAAIPHVDALYDKYAGRGLRVIGMNVFEDGKEKVAKFVAKKGDGMSYPVAYTGKGGAFEVDWLKPAGVNSIPQAFVVKNGKLLFLIHPASLTEKMIDALLAGGDAEAELLKKLSVAKNSKEEIKALVAKFSAQMTAREFPAAEATLREIKDLDENDPSLPVLEMGLAAALEKWDDVIVRLKAEKSSMSAAMLGMQFEMGSVKTPAAVTEAIVAGLEGVDESDAIGNGVKASLLGKLGRKEEAHAAAEKVALALGGMAKDASSRGSLDRYVNSFKTDKPMGLMEMLMVIKEAAAPAGK